MDDRSKSTVFVKYQTIQWLRHRSPAKSNAWTTSLPARLSNDCAASASTKPTVLQPAKPLSASLIHNRPLQLSASAKTVDSLRLSASPLNPHPPRRSKSAVPLEGGTGFSQLSEEVEQKARADAERAIKSKKVFTIIGPYPTLRSALRKRGWVEKFPANSHRKDKDDKPDANENVAPSTEEDSVLTIMSQVVRNCTPTLLFAVKSVDVGSHNTRNCQIVNHFGRSSTFTTKAGLCQNLRNVPWYTIADPDTFYPRCYVLSDPDDKALFLDDYRVTSCCGFIKHFLLKFGIDVSGGDCNPCGRQLSGNKRYGGSKCKISFSGMTTRMALDEVTRENEDFDMKLDCNLTSTVTTLPSMTEEQINADLMPEQQTDSGSFECRIASDIHPEQHSLEQQHSSPADCRPTPDNFSASSALSADNSTIQATSKSCKSPRIPLKALRFAIQHCRNFLKTKDNEDIDILQEKHELTESDWLQFFSWHYAFVNDEEQLEEANIALVNVCKDLMWNMQKKCLQFDIDGCHNVWIIKPGAKSRGRGIQCLDKYESIRIAADSRDCSIVIQKYIERPLLIYKTKFDIRQWFLVTDWNPLTFWFYCDCYLRFCSQEFSLSDLHISIHLSNNSVQKHFAPASSRSRLLPEDNMWTSDEFQDYLRRNAYGRVWTDQIVPGMKQAISCALLCTQEHIECRKSAFELYGADFMLTEDLQPWLIEINSSPSMARNTHATMQLVDNVLEDTLKVVLDRRTDKNSDTGRFELVFKQPPVGEPPSGNINLSIQGKKIRKKIFKR